MHSHTPFNNRISLTQSCSCSRMREPWSPIKLPRNSWKSSSRSAPNASMRMVAVLWALSMDHPLSFPPIQHRELAGEVTISNGVTPEQSTFSGGSPLAPWGRPSTAVYGQVKITIMYTLPQFLPSKILIFVNQTKTPPRHKIYRRSRRPTLSTPS